MSVPVCIRCKSHYWRFRPDHPPPNYCSQFCFDNRKKKAKSTIATPHDVLSRMYDHRRTQHGTPDILVFYDCRVCDELEREYGVSIEYHFAANQAAMLAATR